MAERPFKKILIANRGEIAVRVIRACRELGIATVAVYSEADRDGPPRAPGRRGVPARARPPSRESYLRIDRILEVARRAGADAIHPGLRLPRRERGLRPGLRGRAGIVFIGPAERDHRPHGREDLGAPRRRGRPGVPVVPGTAGAARATRTRFARRGAIGSASPSCSRRRPAAAARACASCAAPEDLAGAAARRAQRGEERLRRRQRLPGEGHRAAAPHRDPGPRRPARQRGPPLRARVLDPAPPPEGHRGEPLALRDARAARADGRRWRWPLVRDGGLRRTPAPSSSWWTRSGSPTSWR